MNKIAIWLALASLLVVAGVGYAEWPDGGLLVCDANNTQFNADIMCINDSTYVVVWEDYRLSGDPQVYVEYVSTEGVVLGGVNGVAIAPALYDQQHPHIVDIGDSALQPSDGGASGRAECAAADGGGDR